ncbi:MAG: hypothetical protein WBQ17_08085 [Rhizomicrobium sp.]
MSDKSNPVLITVLLWLLLSTALVVNALQTGGISLSTDDAMRLAEVRDLLAGQSWFDTTQWRMNAPYGLPMHWSHLIDAGIGGAILLFRQFATPKTAETLALYVWPLLWLLPSLLAIARMGTRLAGRVGGLFALLLGASCSAAVEPFRPGSIDHDNVQLALTLWMMASLVEFDRARWAPIAAALLACLSLAIGMQTLPYVVVAVLVVAAWWIIDGAANAARIRAFGLTFAAASVVLLGGATASAYRFAATCDTFSGFYALLGLAGGCGLAAICSVPALNQSKARRIAAFVGLGAALVALAAITAPLCLKGPYAAVDPRLGPIWFSRIAEVQSPFTLAPQAPGDFLAGYCYAVLATLGAIAAVFLVERQERRAAAAIAAIALAALAVCSVEIRGLEYAQMYALPGLAGCVFLCISRFRLSKAVGAVTTIVALFAASDASFALAGHSIQTSLPKSKQFDLLQESWQSDCLAKADFRTLASLPRGRVLGLVDQGPYILTYTHHAAVSGPYHRDASGIIDTYDVFTGAPAKSAGILARRGIDYVAVCKPAPDYAFYRAHDRGRGILSLLARKQKIAWLEPIPSHDPGKIELYRVRLP